MKINIYDKKYDLTDFIDIHPGGKEILKLCEEEEDCTALFESYHAFADRDKINKMMKLYEIGDSDKHMFKFDDDGFYRVCRRSVINYIIITSNKMYNTNDSLRHEVKANKKWIYTILISVLLFMSFEYAIIYSKYAILKLLYSFLSGVSIIFIGYNVMHDASHYAISCYPIVNNLLSKIGNSIIFSNHILWTYHHCIRHHQYTGNINYDPDLINSLPFIRKSKKSKSTLLTFTKKYFLIKFLIFNIFFPGTLFGQVIIYNYHWIKKKRIWKMNLPSYYKFNNNILQYLLNLLFLYFELKYIGCIYLYFKIVGINFGYFIGSSPDHDMYKTHQEINKLNELNQSCIIDWGEQQVRCSANFLTTYPLFTRFFGGINYQIEHHLFPTMSNHRLKDISHIVKAKCEEFNIPYNKEDTVKGVCINILKTYYDVMDKDD